jgi:hypothetical protein
VGYGKAVLSQVIRHHARQAQIVFDHQELLHGVIILQAEAPRVSLL